MRPIALPILAAALVATAIAAPAGAQPAPARTPNLEGTWTTPGGTGFFAFLHRFLIVGGTTVTNLPTFHLSGGLTSWLSAGAMYSSKTDAKLGVFNELELFSAQRWLDEEAGAPLSLSVREALNVTFMSPDAELNLARRHGPLTLHGTARVLGRYQGGASPRVSTGLGASWVLNDFVRLAADAAYPIYNPAPAPNGEPPVVWGAGLQMVVPNSPHTVSLQVSNAASASMHGAATASDSLRYGFDFTVPFQGPASWFAKPRPAVAAAGAAGADPAQGVGEPAADAPAGEPALPAAKAFFASRCASCHGALGQGTFGPDLRGVEAKGDAFIARRIAEGSPTKGMPPFGGQLAPAELTALVAFVKSL